MIHIPLNSLIRLVFADGGALPIPRFLRSRNAMNGSRKLGHRVKFVVTVRSRPLTFFQRSVARYDS